MDPVRRSAAPARAGRGADGLPVEVANESEIAVDEAELAGVCRYVLAEMKVNPMAELSVLCVDSDYMATLHERCDRLTETGLPHAR